MEGVADGPSYSVMRGGGVLHKYNKIVLKVVTTNVERV